MRKKLGHNLGFGYQSPISDPINMRKSVRGKYCEFANFKMAVVSKTDKSKNKNISNLFRK